MVSAVCLCVCCVAVRPRSLALSPLCTRRVFCVLPCLCAAGMSMTHRIASRCLVVGPHSSALFRSACHAVCLPCPGRMRLSALLVACATHAIRSNRQHRANGDLALHVLEVMEAFQTASDTGTTITITTAVDRPAPLAESLVDGQIGK